jgi:hypothetical protein
LRNRSNALPALTAVLAAVGSLAIASPALAQQARPGDTMGLRYLSWAGKPDAPAAVDGPRRSAVAGPPVPLAANAARYPGIQTASARPPSTRPSRYGVGSGAGLTPASAWTGSSRAAAPAPPPLGATAPSAPAPRGPIPVYSAPQAAEADPAYQAQIQAQYQAWYQSEAQAQYEAQVRSMPQPQQPAVHMQAPAPQQAPQQPQAQQSADAGPAPANDPMAPRGDALIFRMQQPQVDAPAQQQPQQVAPAQAAPARTTSTPTASTQTNSQGEIQSSVLTQPVAGRTPGGQAYAGAEPPREGVRYYSVQRAVGRQPDPIAIPESVYLDNAPIDLAEPPATPVRTRTVNGQAQVVVPNQDPNLP